MLGIMFLWRGTMSPYRLYTLNPEGHISTQPQIIHAENDEQAIAEAKARLNGLDIELWHGTECVIILRSQNR
jgi:hypothetical protein